MLCEQSEQLRVLFEVILVPFSLVFELIILCAAGERDIVAEKHLLWSRCAVTIKPVACEEFRVAFRPLAQNTAAQKEEG